MQGHCPDCYDPGEQQEGIPVGKVENIQLLPDSDPNCFYSVGESSRVIILATDIFGFVHTTTRLLADDLASSCSARVLIPDYFQGDWIQPTCPPEDLERTFLAWLGRQDIELTSKIFGDFVNHTAEYSTTESVIVIGFCWGATPVCRALERPHRKLLAGCIAHGSRIKDYNPAFLKKPLHFIVPEKDEAFPPAAAKRLAAKFPKAVTWTEFANCTHGFVTRPRGNYEKEQQVIASRDIAVFANKHFRTAEATPPTNLDFNTGFCNQERPVK